MFYNPWDLLTCGSYMALVETNLLSNPPNCRKLWEKRSPTPTVVSTHLLAGKQSRLLVAKVTRSAWKTWKAFEQVGIGSLHYHFQSHTYTAAQHQRTIKNALWSFCIAYYGD